MDRLLRALLVAGTIAPLAAAVVWWTADPDWLSMRAGLPAAGIAGAQAAGDGDPALALAATNRASTDRDPASANVTNFAERAASHGSAPREVVPVALHFNGPPTPRQIAGGAPLPQEPPILVWPADEVRDPPPVLIDPTVVPRQDSKPSASSDADVGIDTSDSRDERRHGDPDDPSDSTFARSDAPRDAAAVSPSAKGTDDARRALRRLPPVVKQVPAPEASAAPSPQVAADMPSAKAVADSAVESPVPASESAVAREEPLLELQPANAPPWVPLRRLPPVVSARSAETAEEATLDTAQLEWAPTEQAVPAVTRGVTPHAAAPRMPLGRGADDAADRAPPAFPALGGGDNSSGASDAPGSGVMVPRDPPPESVVAPPDQVPARDAADDRAAAIAADRAMEPVRQRANDHLRSGLAVASRGAFYSGRANFIQALRVLAQALDAQSRSRSHSESLARGLTALEEADDFVPKGSALEADLNVASIVSAHRTPVLKKAGPAPTPLEALQTYYTYAQEQLVAASDHEPSASLALYALGKTHLALARESREAESLHGPKAVTLMRAALMIDASNHLAANELGVMLARYGQLAEARAALVHAVSLGGPVEAWHNLAVVHERLGEDKLARAALAQWQAASRQGQGGTAAAASGSAIRWVDAATFASTSETPTSNVFIPSGSAQVSAAAPSASQPQGARTGQQPWQGFRK